MNEVNIFKNYYKSIKEKLNNKINEFNTEISSEKIELIKENIELFCNLNCDGKLVRGTLVNLGYNLIKDDSDYSLDLALAFEIFQTAILIHDDIIDNDQIRRGKETIHYANYKKYNDLTKDNESKKMSESLALCMGDLGLYYANNVIAKSYKNDKNLGEILSYFNEIVINTIKGEMLDVALPFLEKNNINKSNLYDSIIKIYELKTAYYTVIGPLCLGMLLAGSDSEKIDDITKFGLNIGLSFQMQDDYLGIYGDTKVLGKSVGSDIEEYKQTIMYSYVKEKNEYLEELKNIYGKENTLESVKELFEKSGAKEYTLNKIDELYNESLSILDNINWIEKDKKDILKGFVYYLKERKK